MFTSSMDFVGENGFDHYDGAKDLWDNAVGDARLIMNTKFEKEMFTWDGMYLMYKGDFAGSVKMETVNPATLVGLVRTNHSLLLGSSIVNHIRLGLTS